MIRFRDRGEVPIHHHLSCARERGGREGGDDSTTAWSERAAAELPVALSLLALTEAARGRAIRTHHLEGVTQTRPAALDLLHGLLLHVGLAHHHRRQQSRRSPPKAWWHRGGRDSRDPPTVAFCHPRLCDRYSRYNPSHQQMATAYRQITHLHNPKN